MPVTGSLTPIGEASQRGKNPEMRGANSLRKSRGRMESDLPGGPAAGAQ